MIKYNVFNECAKYMTNYKTYGGPHILVHGICISENGEPYAHAWIEFPSRGEAMGFGLVDINQKKEKTMYTGTLNEFYEKFEVIDTTKYNYFDAMDNFKNKKTHGPWEEKYLKLCKDYA